MNETTFSFIKEETVDIETVMLNQEPLGNSMDCIRSNCNLEKNRSPTIVNDVKEVFSGSIYLDFECKDDPLRVDFDGSNKRSTTYNEVTNHNPNLDTILDCKIESVKESGNLMHDNYKNFISVQYPLNLKKEFTKHNPQQLYPQNRLAEKLHSCPYCELKCHCLSRKNSHIMTIHDQIRPFKCKFCEHSSAYQFNLKAHNATVHGSANLQLQDQICHHCNYKGHPTNMKQHTMAVHDHIKPFKCQFCEYSSATSCRLKTHNASVHKNEYLELQKQILQSCSFCDYQTTSSELNKLSKHITAVHDNIRPYKCKFCDHSAAYSYTLKIHVKDIHDQMRAFQCKFCEFSASNFFNLKRHVEVHRNKT